MTGPLVIILQEELQDTVGHKHEFKHAVQNVSVGTSFWQPKRRKKHVEKRGHNAGKCVDQVPNLKERIRSQNDKPVEPRFLHLRLDDFSLALDFALNIVFNRVLHLLTSRLWGFAPIILIEAWSEQRIDSEHFVFTFNIIAFNVLYQSS